MELYEGVKGSKREVVINTEWGALGNTGRYFGLLVSRVDKLLVCLVWTLSAPGGT